MVVSQSSVLYGLETPRLWTYPLRDLTPETTRGFECITFAEDILGLSLHPWQKWLLKAALELKPDGSYRFRTVLVVVSRQSGKTLILGVLALWKMFLDDGHLVLGTSTNLAQAKEAWLAAVNLAESTPELADLIEHIDRAAGGEALRLKTGERYKIAAANRRGGRGLSSDLCVLDELREHKTWDAWSSISKTTLARSNAQTWCFSSAGDIRSVVLKHLRDKALAEDRTDDTLAIFEWSADEAAEIDDRDAWAQANPSMGRTITVDAIASACDTDPEAIFRTEVLGQWVDSMSDPVFGRGAWEACITHDSNIETRLSFGVAVSMDRAWSCIGAAGRNAEGLLHVEPIEYKRGTSWIAARVVELLAEHGRATPVVVDGRGPAASLIHDLEDAGVDVTVASTSDVTDAAAALYDAVSDQRVAHLDDADLNNAVGGAQKRPVGDRWAWGRKQSTSETSPLEAVTLAAWAVSLADDRSPLETLYF